MLKASGGSLCFDLPRRETRNAPQSFLSLELFEMNIFWALLLLLPGPTLTVSDIRSFWESLTEAIVSDHDELPSDRPIVLDRPGKNNFTRIMPKIEGVRRSGIKCSN